MSKERDTVVNFVSRTDDPNEWRMVLVEQGPWNGGSERELRRIQDRLYGCLDAAIDGQLAEQFPETRGKNCHHTTGLLQCRGIRSPGVFR